MYTVFTEWYKKIDKFPFRNHGPAGGEEKQTMINILFPNTYQSRVKIKKKNITRFFFQIVIMK